MSLSRREPFIGGVAGSICGGRVGVILAGNLIHVQADGRAFLVNAEEE
jgi:hypothetical protein